MAFRRTRTGRLARAAQDGRHSGRSSLVKSSRTNPTRTGHQGMTQESPNQPVEPLLPRLMSWSDTLALVEEQSLETQVQTYKEWKRECIPFRLLSPGVLPCHHLRHTGNGSAHENYCRVCQADGESLEPCSTCRLAFHADCIPAGWLRDSQNSLFCPICVLRGWHTTPPTLSPPASPPPEERNDSRSAAAPTTSASDPDTNSSSNTHPHSSASDGPLGVSSIQQAPTGDRHDVPASGPTAPKRLYDLLGHDDEATEDNVTSQRPRRQRKSRYTNLPTEVDTALSVLYRELESNESLKREVEELRNENTKCNQSIRIRDLSIIALRRELDYRRSSHQEMETLRATATQLENAKKEIQELRARNEALSMELQTSREETAEAQALVRDWKAKLSQLIGN
ncbi:PHD finger protein [Aspergillus vadensis CBS 113365]|uniref:Zinc finger PHD-type domain-containing protein n=1 Tax=Aspergillus vadensis (strain CBS 113365 / IMI 142717 / IBT 24658) TaxID=1448311 RepID=A0A319B7T9_ASPVC|nr:hypothetical protein BO88DRAFT_405857 [Aspergillus vadensis CBS 113365]PYH67874.1 hypothetical protein BO88DRAFT_405857 [Aspergillus vadensis CBS 113365]